MGGSEFRLLLCATSPLDATTAAFSLYAGRADRITSFYGGVEKPIFFRSDLGQFCDVILDLIHIFDNVTTVRIEFMFFGISRRMFV